MSKVKNENFIVIQGWMISELGLKGNELLIYAIIYGFSQDEETLFKGGLQYLTDWTNSSKPTVLNALKNLLDKGFIEKIETNINGVKFCDYRSRNFTGVVKNLYGGGKEILPDNINNNIDNKIVINKKENKKKKETLSSVINEYTDNEELRECLKEFVEMRKAGQKGMFTVYALKQNLGKLDKLAVNDGAKIDIVNQTLEHTWKSFYPLQEGRNNQKGGTIF